MVKQLWLNNYYLSYDINRNMFFEASLEVGEIIVNPYSKLIVGCLAVKYSVARCHCVCADNHFKLKTA